MLERALPLTALLDRPNSREAVAGLLESFAVFGVEATDRMTRNVANLPRDNPFRHVGTVIYRLKKEAMVAAPPGDKLLIK